MKQQDLAKIGWNDNTIDLYTQVLNNKIPPNITKQQLRTIVKNINTYKLELDDNDTIIYTPNNVKIIRPSKYDNILQKFYNSTQLGLGKGIKKFHSTVNSQYVIPRNTVEAWLKKQGDYQIQRSVIKNKDNDKIVALRPNDVWMIDVMKLPRYKDENDNITMLYNIIDVFSRKLWSFTLKAETEQLSIEVYDDLTQQLGVVPKRVITDGGPTFGRNFKNFVEYNYDRFEPESNQANIKAYEDYRAKRNKRTKYIYGTPYSPTSQSHIERAQKSLRDRIRALIVKKGNFNYVNDYRS